MSLPIKKTSSIYKYLDESKMNTWLSENSLPVPLGSDEVRPWDILVLKNSKGLVHTAIYLGESEWFHKKGQRLPEITNSMNEMIKEYSQASNSEITTSFRRPLNSPHIKLLSKEPLTMRILNYFTK